MRATEASITSDGKNIVNSLSYDEGRLFMTVGTVGADKTSTSRTYFPGSNDLQRYDESAPTYSTTRNYRLDDNGNQVYSEALCNDQGGKLEQSAAITYDHADNAIAESLGFQGAQDWLSADLKIDYYCTDSYKEQKVGGTTQGPGGPKGVNPASAGSYLSLTVIFLQLLPNTRICYQYLFFCTRRNKVETVDTTFSKILTKIYPWNCPPNLGISKIFKRCCNDVIQA